MTTPVSGTTTTPAQTASKTSSSDGTLGQDAFMKLLVAQLKYQNPMAPADGQQYMTQMATFTQVEKLGQLVTAQNDVAQWQKRLSAEGLVGQSVTGTTDDGSGVTGVVTGVRFDKDGPVLELADGRTLDAGSVTRTTAAPATTTPTTPAGPTGTAAGSTPPPSTTA